MPFKNPNGRYACQLRLPGYGQLPRIALGTDSLTDAKAFEEAIRRVDRYALRDPSLDALLDALKPEGKGKRGRIRPVDLFKTLRRDGDPTVNLHALLRTLTDPPLADAIDQMLAEVSMSDAIRSRQAFIRKTVLDVAASLRPPIRTLGDLDSGSINRLLSAIANDRGILPASVVRNHQRLLSKTIRFHQGEAGRARAFENVTFTAGDSRRQLREHIVTAPALGRLVDELRAGYQKRGDDVAPLLVHIAVTTGATVGPLCLSLNRHFHPGTENSAPTLFLAGTKKARKSGGSKSAPDTSGRDRDLTIPSGIAEQIEHYHAPSDPDGLLFGIKKTRFSTMFNKARARAGLMEACLDGRGRVVPITPHDLRHVAALFARKTGLPPETIQAMLGHDDPERTSDYMRSVGHRATQADADRLAEVLGL